MSEYIVMHNPHKTSSPSAKEKIKILEGKQYTYEEIYVPGILGYSYFRGTKQECDKFFNDLDEDVKDSLIVISVDEAKELYPAND